MNNAHVLWLCTCTDRPVGLVKVFDEIEQRWKFYIGTGYGQDVNLDVQAIIDWGQKFDNLDFFGKVFKNSRRGMTMTNEKAIKWMEEAVQETTECFEQCSPSLQKELVMQKEVFELALTALRSMPETTKPGWISVKERLPERFEPVLVCREKNGSPYVEQGYKDVGEWWKVYGTRTKHITHWMPLPEPPEEG